MRKSLALLIVFVVSVLINVNASDKKVPEPLAAYRQDGKWHIIDYSGNELIQPSDFDEVFSFSDGLIRVKLKDENKWGFIDMSGKIALTYTGDFVDDFKEGMAMTEKFTDDSKTNKKYGFINKKGEQILPNSYDEVLNFNEGLAYIMKPGERGYIDKKAKMVINLAKKTGYDFSAGLAPVSDPTFKMGYIDKKGKIVIPLQFDEAHSFSEGLAAFNMYGKFGFIDMSGKKIIDNIYDEIHPFHERLAFAGNFGRDNKTKWGVIDTLGHFIAYYQFDNIRDFNEGTAAVQKEKFWGFIDKTGKYTIPARYSYADSFKNGLAWASIKDDGKYGFINKSGEMVIDLSKADKVIDLRWNRNVK